MAGSRTVLSVVGGYLYGNYKDQGVPRGTFYYFENSNTKVTAPDGTILPVPAALQGPAGNFTPSSYQTLREVNDRQNLNAIASRTFEWHGQHELRTGYTLNHLANDALSSTYPGGLIVLCWACSYSSATVLTRTRGPYGFYFNRLNEIPGKVSSSNHGLFIQDSWRIRRDFHINAGLRAEREFVPSFRPDAGSPPILFPFTSKLAPRLGLAYAPNGTGRTRIYASFGLYYDVMKYSLARRSFGAYKLKDWYYTLDDPQFLTIRPQSAPFSQQSAFPGSLIDTVDYSPPADDPQDTRIDPNLKPMRQRAYSAGIDRSIGPVIASVRYVRKRLDRTIEDMGIYTPAGEKLYIVNPGEGMSVSRALFPAGYPQPAFPKPVRNYDALELGLEIPRLHQFLLRANYTLSRLYGNYSGLASSDEGGRLSPNASRYFDEPWMLFNAQGGRVLGPLATDRTHGFKSAMVFAPRTRIGTTSLGIVFTALSGAPATTEVELVGSGLVSLVNGRADLGRTPPLTNTDALLAHELRLTERVRLRVEANVMNVFNQATITSIYGRYNHPNDGPIAFTDLAATMRGVDYMSLMRQQGIRVDPLYGQANGFLGPRDVRLGLHLTF